jgi:hypothetical protein
MITRGDFPHGGTAAEEDAKDDFAALDSEKSVRPIYKKHGEAKLFWSVNTSPFPAPPPDNGPAKSLEATI